MAMLVWDCGQPPQTNCQRVAEIVAPVATAEILDALATAPAQMHRMASQAYRQLQRYPGLFTQRTARYAYAYGWCRRIDELEG